MEHNPAEPQATTYSLAELQTRPMQIAIIINDEKQQTYYHISCVFTNLSGEIPPEIKGTHHSK